MKKFGIALVVAVFAVGLALGLQPVTAWAEGGETGYKLTAHELTYGSLPSGYPAWCGAPNDAMAYVSDIMSVNPGQMYQTAVTFAAPADGTIMSNSGSLANVSIKAGDSDGARIAVYLNETKLYPAGETLWADISVGEAMSVRYADAISVRAGDKLRYVVENGGNGNNDGDAAWLIVGFHWTDDTQTSVWFDNSAGGAGWTDAASGEAEYMGYKKSRLLSYEYVSVAEIEVRYELTANTLTYGKLPSDYPAWCGAPNDSMAYVADNNSVNPGQTYQTAIAFTAPADGTVTPDGGSIGSAVLQYAGGDGARLTVFLNDRKIFPTLGLWADIPAAGSDRIAVTQSAPISMQAGDKLRYIVDNGGNGNNDSDAVPLIISFHWTDDTQSNVWFDNVGGAWTDAASGETEYIGYKKSWLLSYEYVRVQAVEAEPEEKADVETDKRKIRTRATDFTYTTLNGSELWGGVPSDADVNCYILGGQTFSPSANYAAAVTFAAPSDGRISNGAGCGTIYRSGQVTATSDGTRLTVALNDEVLFPYTGVWFDVPQGADNKAEISFNAVDVKAGDRLMYIVDCGSAKNSEWDVNILDAGFRWIDETNPRGVWVSVFDNFWTNAAEDGAEDVTFGSYARKDVFRYQYVVVDDCTPLGAAQEYEYTESSKIDTEKLMYSAADNRYYNLYDPNLFAYDSYCNPGMKWALGVRWTAPESGRVDISGTFVENYYYQTEPDAGGARSDGVRFKILADGKKQIYPATGEWVTLNSAAKHIVNFAPIAVKAGEELLFILDKNGESNYDICRFNLTVAFAATGEDYTDKYNNVLDFAPEADLHDAWTYLAVDLDPQEEQQAQEDPLQKVTYSADKGCGSDLIAESFALAGLSLLAAAFALLRRHKEEI